jgi:uncharacterized protein
MVEGSFSHSLLWHNSISAICFFSFAMSFISLWIRKTTWMWGSFLFIAYILAFEAKIVTWMSLIPVLILFFCHYLFKKGLLKEPLAKFNANGKSMIVEESPPRQGAPKGDSMLALNFAIGSKSARFLLICIAIGVSLALAFHFLPGFNNWKVASNLCISPGAYPYSLWFNFDKPFIGLFALAFSIPLISSKTELFRVLKMSIPMSIVGILVMVAISLYFNLVKWDPKIPIIIFVWFFDNLIFVSIPEEAFFRGFIQRELYFWFGKTPVAGLGSIFVTSIFFTLLHLIWVANLSFLCFVFVASMIYGAIYQVTQSIEASILCHFGLNLVHFLLFTYPALQVN